MRTTDVVLISNEVITQNSMTIAEAGTENICLIAKCMNKPVYMVTSLLRFFNAVVSEDDDWVNDEMDNLDRKN